jgi:hypothetical protein
MERSGVEIGLKKLKQCFAKDGDQGCQMVYFQLKNPNKFGRALE